MAKAATATKAPVAPKMGRPTTYNEASADELLRRVEDGQLILDICDDPEMPSWSTLCGWKRRNPDFAAAYAHARETSAEALEIKAIQRSREAKDSDSAAAARIEVDTLKWAAAKRNPRYSDRIDHNHTGKVTLEALVTAAQQIPGPATIEGSVEDEDENAS